MQIKANLIVSDVYQGERSHYITGVDRDTGGLVKIGVEGPAAKTLTPGASIVIEGTIKPGLGQRGLYLTYLGKTNNGG